MDKEKYKEGNYGYMPLTEVVNSYMNDSFNDGRKYMTNMLRIGADVWNKFYHRTLKIPKTKVLEINKSTNTADIPLYYDALPKVFIVDECNKLQQLFSDDNYNVVDMVIKPKRGCGCTKCNCDNEVCAASAQVTFVEEDVIINNQTYKHVTQRKLCSNGDIIEEVSGYVAQGSATQDGTFTVVPFKDRKFISNVAVKTCGCVINVPDNNEKVIDACRCAVICCFPGKNNQIPVALNKHGHFKMDIERGVIHLIGVKQNKIIFSCNSNTKSDEEIMIPEFALDFMKTGMHFRSLRFRNNISDGKIQSAKREHSMEEQELLEFLNPIDYVEWKEFKSGFFPKW